MNERLRVLCDEAMNEAAKQYGAQRKGEKAWHPHVFEHLFSEMIIDECCFVLLMMDAKVQGQHSYYKHAAIELKRKFKEQS